ncbi:hypothetical protein VCR4J2_570200 [Vibrio coralliirubri]|nr:hypothetical protein VCR4J2_570200 [Vibrio coralliirubri]
MCVYVFEITQRSKAMIFVWVEMDKKGSILIWLSTVSVDNLSQIQ